MKKLFWLIPYMMILVLVFYNVASAVEIGIKWKDEDPNCTTGEDCYQIGDIISIKENNAWWGSSFDPRLDPNSDFVIFQITDLTMQEALASQWNQPLYNITDPENPIIIKKRQFNIDKVGKVPQNIINYIENNDGFIVTDKATVNGWLHNKEGEL